MTIAWRRVVDQTATLLVQGYGFLPDLRRAHGSDVVPLRLLGRRAVAACGPQWAEQFYDDELFERAGVVPEPVQGTLMGHGSVHGLDREDHLRRRSLFTSALAGDGGAARLASYAAQEWESAQQGWVPGARINLFEESSRLLLRAVWRWAGLPDLTAAEADRAAADMVAMVDGFGSVGVRHVRSRRARLRQERLLADVVDRVRSGAAEAAPDTALAALTGHHDRDGDLLPARTAAVEVLNFVRPTVAVAWFVSFAGHALAHWPETVAGLEAGSARTRAFTHEVRRFYPFAPFVAARARQELRWESEQIRRGDLVLLDLYGQNHHQTLWPEPYRFAPSRFLDLDLGHFDLVPQGGGDPQTSHRCPGEPAAVDLLETLVPLLARLDHRVPPQDMTIPLRRVPTRPRDGVVLEVLAGGQCGAGSAT
jgi:fatty-acid peroxygenase